MRISREKVAENREHLTPERIRHRDAVIGERCHIEMNQAMDDAGLEADREGSDLSGQQQTRSAYTVRSGKRDFGRELKVLVLMGNAIALGEIDLAEQIGPRRQRMRAPLFEAGHQRSQCERERLALQ